MHIKQFFNALGMYRHCVLMNNIYYTFVGLTIVAW
jgi:hypothetical protein